MHDNQSTLDHAYTIYESWLNGQKKQAVEQFQRALYDNCSAQALLDDIYSQSGDAETVIALAGRVIDKE